MTAVQKRWWIAGLIFLATLINFVNRLTVSVLAPVITKDLGLTKVQYAAIANALPAFTPGEGAVIQHLGATANSSDAHTEALNVVVVGDLVADAGNRQ